ncbi:head-tail connector protein [Clostridium perfringens]|mgnify:FL=1|nr:head-tail connector protein [Clostridium perfringens]MDM0969773.1 head-tail connector protein [Clostridium perfringens]MDM0972522.1 head-tail connector protein [Clostridium perfringens]DAL45201.1 MAG TPA_asm: head tail connector [Caudoviricetes sp.]
MKDLNIEFVKQYLKVDFPDDDLLIDTIIKGVKSYIISYTGLKKDEADKIEELKFAALLLIEQMYSNRSALVETDKINFALTTILDMHARNNL